MRNQGFLATKKYLEKLYDKYNDRKYIHPDPLEFLYDYDNADDREVAGLIASSLAYGQVRQIIKSVSKVLKKIGPKPADFLKSADRDMLDSCFPDFKHRFTTGSELVEFLQNTGLALKKYGTLNDLFYYAFKKEQEIIPALLFFIKELRQGQCSCYNSLIPMPTGKCAYKRMNLFLRWMIRKDNVDPGGWEKIPASSLIVPLDIHMHRISRKLGFTHRKQADINTAIQITNEFKRFAPNDPVKYDFALTREPILLNNKPDLLKHDSIRDDNYYCN